jgi:hypothetical protein
MISLLIKNIICISLVTVFSFLHFQSISKFSCRSHTHWDFASIFCFIVWLNVFCAFHYMFLPMEAMVFIILILSIPFTNCTFLLFVVFFMQADNHIFGIVTCLSFLSLARCIGYNFRNNGKSPRKSLGTQRWARHPGPGPHSEMRGWSLQWKSRRDRNVVAALLSSFL